jgi:hypothetical protein
MVIYKIKIYVFSWDNIVFHGCSAVTACNFLENQMARLFLDLAGNQVSSQGCSQIGEFTSLISHSIEKPCLVNLTPMN